MQNQAKTNRNVPTTDDPKWTLAQSQFAARIAGLCEYIGSHGSFEILVPPGLRSDEARVVIEKVYSSLDYVPPSANVICFDGPLVVRVVTEE